MKVFPLKLTQEKKRLLSCSYNPYKNNIGTHFQTISKAFDKLSRGYDNIILLGDFDVEPEEVIMSEPLYSLNCILLLLTSILSELLVYSLKKFASQKTCFKNLGNRLCIDLILTNCSCSFQNTGVFETGLSDFYKLTLTVLKQYYPKQKPKNLKWCSIESTKISAAIYLEANLRMSYLIMI